MIYVLQIPDSITSLEKVVFSSCTGLTSIIIPTSVTSIKEDALSGCYELNTINYMGTEEQWDAIAMDYTSHIELLNRATIVFNYTVA